MRIDHVPAGCLEGGDPEDARAPFVGLHCVNVLASQRRRLAGYSVLRRARRAPRVRSPYRRISRSLITDLPQERHLLRRGRPSEATCTLRLCIEPIGDSPRNPPNRSTQPNNRTSRRHRSEHIGRSARRCPSTEAPTSTLFERRLFRAGPRHHIRRRRPLVGGRRNTLSLSSLGGILSGLGCRAACRSGRNQRATRGNKTGREGPRRDGGG